MGTNIKDLTNPSRITIDSLKGKTLVVDSFNLFFQFLTTIRQRDGEVLRDSHGNVTSVLVGLQSRIPKLIQKGIKLAFVIDGTPPTLKFAERERRKGIKIEAQKKYETAKEKADEESMKKYASRTSRLTENIISDACLLLQAYGCPVIQAPSEGEAQAAYITTQGDAYAVLSQDFDSLLNGAPRLVRNLSLSARRKQPGAFAFNSVQPEIFDLQSILQKNSLSQDQLIAIAILVGTDYNYGGIKGIGPKKALKLVHQHQKIPSLFEAIYWNTHCDTPWQDIFETIKNMPVEKNYKLSWKPFDVANVKHILCDQHDFSESRVEEQLQSFIKIKTPKSQKGLGDFL